MSNNEMIALLELANSFVADKNELRHYLQDVYFKQVDNDIHIVAADGHKLCKITIKDYKFSLPERIKSQSIKDANKVNEINLIKESHTNLSTPYPDYQRLIPNDCKLESRSRLNPIYLSTMASALVKCNKKIKGRKMIGIDLVNISATNGNVFESNITDNINVVFVIMPMRM